MSLRRYLALVGAAAIIAAAVGLLTPAHLDATYEAHSVSCGNAFGKLPSNAGAADEASGYTTAFSGVPATNYATQCRSAINTRRAWGIPLAVLGAVVLIGSRVVVVRSN